MLKRLVFALAAICAATALAHAQSSLGIGNNEVAPTPATGEFFALIYQWQQQFFRALQKAMITIRNSGTGGTWLIAMSFAYGVFHAAGPGHGKAVISSYMMANEVALRRGIVLSFASSLAQAVSAILLVGTAYLLLRGASVSMTDATHAMELGSYVLIILFGLSLLWRKIGGLLRKAQTPAATAHHHVHHDHEDHGHDHDHAHHHHHAEGEVCSECGHAHIPDPSQLKAGKVSLRDAVSIILAVGLRPCSGAIVVLSFALLNGLYLAGLASVLAMSLGTAITVSALATLAVFAKDKATGLSGRWAGMVGHAIEIAGALAVTVLGVGLLVAGLNA